MTPVGMETWTYLQQTPPYKIENEGACQRSANSWVKGIKLSSKGVDQTGLVIGG